MPAEEVCQKENMQASPVSQQHQHIHHKEDAGQERSSQRKSTLQQKKKQEQEQQQQLLQEPQQPESQPFRWWQQLLLMAGLFGNEATSTFEQIYTYLGLQYVGVPVRLMSLPGAIGGGAGFVLVPAIGYLVNKGTNTKLRKMIALLIAMSFLLCGYFIVSLAFTLKLMKGLNNEYDDGHDVPLENDYRFYVQNVTPVSPWGAFPNTSSELRDSVYASRSIHSGIFQNESKVFIEFISIKTTANIIHDYTISSGSDNANTSDQPEMTTLTPNGHFSLSIPVSAVLGILGFSIIDTGFDLSNSMTRAYVLEYAPSSQHNKMLVSATLMASFAGTLMSFIGIFDLQSALGDIFHVDGVAAAFLLTVGILVFVVISSFSCTFITAWMLNNRFKNDSANTHAHLAGSNTAENLNNEKQVKKGMYVGKEFAHSDPAYKDRSSTDRTNSKLGTDEVEMRATIEGSSIDGGNEETPLFIKRECPTKVSGYMSFSICISSPRQSEVDDFTMSSAESIEIGDFTSNIHTTEGFELSASDIRNFYSNSGEYLETKRLDTFKPLNPKYSAPMQHSESKSSDLCGEFYSETLVHLRKRPEQKEGKIATPLLDKRVILLMVSITFSASSIISFIMFMPNALTIEILHGDPSAEPGTEGYEKYKEGLRTSALGSFVYSISYLLTCVFINKIFELIGEKMLFMVCHLFMTGSILAVLLTQRVEVFYLCMTLYGPLRSCTYTLPFVLANTYTQEKDEPATGDNHEGSKTSKAGRVMTIIWSIFPLNNLIVSCVMGPLIDVTGNAWVPLIWCVIGNVISMLVFSVLFFV